MNLWLRLFWVYLQTFSDRRLGILDTSSLQLVSFPNDLDVYGHMNNGRYLTLMDLGRMDLILRTGMGAAAKKNRWYPLVGSVNIRYRKSLRVFQAFEIHTRITGWDEKWFFIEQKFKTHGHDVAAGLIKGLFYGPKGKVPPAEVVAAFSKPLSSPSMPDAIRLWLTSESKVTGQLL